MELTVALAQIDSHVGALEHNLHLMLESATRARDAGAGLVVFPELALTGYPPEDLLLKPIFLERLARVERELLEELGRVGIAAIYGSVHATPGGIFNAGVLAVDGERVGSAAKYHLPNYSVFDEKRYFTPAERLHPLEYRGWRLGVTICEDIWHAGPPVATLAAAGAEVIINLNASPYHLGKQPEREAVVAERCREHRLPALYVNLVGGQDELVFDGGSFALDATGAVVGRAPQFRSDLLFIKLRRAPDGGVTLQPTAPVLPALDPESELYQALCLGVRDYVTKNGFAGVVLGLSGGIDSALVAAICADALGAERVEVVMMPSEFTSHASLEDAAGVAAALGLRLVSLPIDPMFREFKRVLAGEFTGLAEDVTEENLQPRIRATLLMALSNKKGRIVVTTGNKSELSTGYATLYGDMAGGFAVLKDVLKEYVYLLAAARNRWAVARGEPPPIPENILIKPPTAELRHNQQDTDSLPPYPVLDRIIRGYVEQELAPEQLVAQGLDPAVVSRVVKMIDRNEYKRRQGPPGVRVTQKGFGKDRRYPITNGFRVE